jgi:Skp family chaperone for outer membrane proteins
MMRTKILFLFPLVIAVVVASAQSPAPIIVQPANAPVAATSTSTKAVAAGADAQSISGAIKALEQIKAGNAEILGKQQAALQKLDELQGAADQLRILAKRG